MLAILDYDAGNQTSVFRALQHLQIPSVITADASVLEQASGVIFPGVGSAGQAMDNLSSRGLDKLLVSFAASGKPLLGICLGCQILLERSEEGDIPTLGILKGTTRRFPDNLLLEDGSKAPVPHMGWNGIEIQKDDPLFQGISSDARFYFVHSFYVEPEPSLVLATTSYGMSFCSAYGKPGLWAVQFHPEKSGRFGLQILRNFHNYCQGVSNAL